MALSQAPKIGLEEGKVNTITPDYHLHTLRFKPEELDAGVLKQILRLYPNDDRKIAAFGTRIYDCAFMLKPALGWASITKVSRHISLDYDPSMD